MLNTVGTIAMALSTNADGSTNDNSAVSEYFFNLVNTPRLDTQGFTVFGQVADPESMRVINTIAALSTSDQHIFGGAQHLPADLSTLPLKNYTNPNFPTGLTSNNLAFINNVSTLRPARA